MSLSCSTKSRLEACGTTFALHLHQSAYDEPRLIGIARDAVSSAVKGSPQSKIEAKHPVLPVFVTIEVGGVLRGCRGSLITRTTSLEAEIAQSARSAAAHDPKYKPLKQSELRNFLVTVTVVERKEPIAKVDSLQPSEGLALESGGRWGIVLPYEGKDPATRLKWAYQKAGVPPGSPANTYRLVASRFRG